jgi:hypothetical protein
MRVFPQHPFPSRRTALLAAASLIWVAAGSCATQQPIARPGSLRLDAEVRNAALQNAQPVLLFDNASTESVTVYLGEYGSRRLIGHVQPGQRALLPLPVTLAEARARQFAVVVVPLAAPTFLGRASVARNASIESEPMLGDYVAATQWRYVGRQLLGVPLPR